MRIFKIRYSRLLRSAGALLVFFLGVALLPGRAAVPSSKPVPVPMLAQACPRGEQGAPVAEPPALRSRAGRLDVRFSFQTRTDQQGRQLYCFMTEDGMQDPTLHIMPGDRLTLTVTNNTPKGSDPMTIDSPNCGATTMDTSSVNIHYHGTNVSPHCQSDEVVKTLINSGQTFQYQLDFPRDEPPGMYWYHPHIHGMSDNIVTGGATGAIIVDGIETMQPALRGLPQHVLVVRDQAALSGTNEGPANCGNGIPFRDVSVNYVPVNSYVASGSTQVTFVPATLNVPAGETQFWRVGNTSADTILDLQLVYDGVAQNLAIVAIDGVPVNSQDGTGPGSPVGATHFRLPPAARVEFIARMPSAATKVAQFQTANINTGAVGDCDPMRPLIQLATPARSSTPLAVAAPARQITAAQGRRFASLRRATVTAQRTLYFDENAKQTEFYMTPAGQPNRPYSPNQAPGITTLQNAVEEWTIENHTQENHEFHIHQLHFLVQSQDNFGHQPLAPAVDGQYLDTIEVPAWDGSSKNYPSVKLKMDFRGAVVGDFVFHCHILNHEDLGMMNIIRVLQNTAENRKKMAMLAK